MKNIRIKNTPENIEQLQLAGAAYTIEGKYITVWPSGKHLAYMESGQMSIRSYKKNYLCV